MSGLTLNVLNILIYIFKRKDLFIFIGGLMTCTYLFTYIRNLINGDFY